MGYAFYERDGMERGYGVPDVCHAEGCDAQIDRGLAYLCYGCTRYFCYRHLMLDGDVEFECFAGQSRQCCAECQASVEADDSEPSGKGATR